MQGNEDRLIETAGQFTRAWQAIQNMIHTLPRCPARDKADEALDLARLWTKEAMVQHLVADTMKQQPPPESEPAQQPVD